MTKSQQTRLSLAKTIGISKAKKIASQCSSIAELDAKLLNEVNTLKIKSVSPKRREVASNVTSTGGSK